MPAGDGVEPFGRRDDQQFHRFQRRLAQQLGRQHRQGQVDAVQALDVDCQAVEENRRQRMAGDLRQARVARRFGRGGRRFRHASRTHHQHFICAQVNGWRDRCQLAHGSVAAVFALAAHVQGYGGEDEGDGGRRQQMLHADLVRQGQALRAHPRCDIFGRLVKRHVAAVRIRRCRHGQRMQQAVGQGRVQARQVEHAVQQADQRGIVEQGTGRRRMPLAQQPAERQQGQPARARADHAQRIGSVHLLDFDVLPHVEQLLHAFAEIIGTAGQRRGVDGTGRGAADDVERVARRCPARFPQYR
ncbi:hypothetical protein D3C72_1358040 [compost metagenome]